MNVDPGESLPDPRGDFTVQILDRLEALSAQLVTVTENLAAVASQANVTAAREKRTRRLAVGLAASFTLDILLTVVVSILSVTALSQNGTLHASQLASCSLSNQTRADERVLWSYLFALSDKPKSAAEVKFLAFVDKTFAPENCAALYK